MQVTGEMVAIKKFKDSEGFAACLSLAAMIVRGYFFCHNTCSEAVADAVVIRITVMPV